MSARTSIAKALAEKLKSIDGTGVYKSNIFGNAYPKLKFWDEVSNFPSIYMSIGSEGREYLPGEFKWGMLGISLKLYVKCEEPTEALENLIEDVERVLDTNRNLVYDTSIPGGQTTEILINSIVTDEGLLEPYGVSDVVITIQYQVIK